jgi:hypothetical protein
MILKRVSSTGSMHMCLIRFIVDFCVRGFVEYPHIDMMNGLPGVAFKFNFDSQCIPDMLFCSIRGMNVGMIFIDTGGLIILAGDKCQ